MCIQCDVEVPSPGALKTRRLRARMIANKRAIYRAFAISCAIVLALALIVWYLLPTLSKTGWRFGMRGIPLRFIARYVIDAQSPL